MKELNVEQVFIDRISGKNRVTAFKYLEKHFPKQNHIGNI